MGQGKGGGYKKKSTVTKEQKRFLDQMLSQAGKNQAAASQGFTQFLPGGGGGQPIINAANKNFQEQTVPSILNTFGTGSKGSSALNQALAASASNLNTDLAAQLAQMQLSAASGLGGLGAQQGQLGSQDQFAYLQRAKPFWQSALEAGIGAAGSIGGGQAAAGSKILGLF